MRRCCERQARQASRIALITLALYFVTMASQVVTAWNSKRTNERRWHMTVPLLLGSAGLMCALPCSAVYSSGMFQYLLMVQLWVVMSRDM